MVKNTNGRENGIQQHIRDTLGTPGRHKLSYIRLVLTKHRSLLQQTKHLDLDLSKVSKCIIFINI